MAYLNEIKPLSGTISIELLDNKGRTGPTSKLASIQGQHYQHAFVVAPSRMVFPLEGRYAIFRCRVALHDDVPAFRASADFTVIADGRAVAAYVVAGQPPQELTLDISGVQQLELLVQSNHAQSCLAVWIDPQVGMEGEALRFESIPILKAQTSAASPLPTDCLSRAEISVPPQTERCIATVVSPGYAHLLDDMLGSLQANGNCPDALVAVFAVDADAECYRVIAKHGALAIPCRALAPRSAALKAVMYSVAHVVSARQYLCLDADLLILGDLTPLFAALDACTEESILVARGHNNLEEWTLEATFHSDYFGRPDELRGLFQTSPRERMYPLSINDGVFAGSRQALLCLDRTIRDMGPEAIAWMDDPKVHCPWRNQFLFNLALARLNCGVEINGVYN